MRRDQIEVGKTYTNGKDGRHLVVRRVIGAGPQFTLFQGQMDQDCLAYAIVQGRLESIDLGRTEAGEQIKYSTRTSFAAWAREVVDASA